MLFDMKYVANWEQIRDNKLKQIIKDNNRENSLRTQHTYKEGDKVLLKRDYLKILRKTEFLHTGPYKVVNVFENGALCITDETSGATTTVNNRCLKPFHEQLMCCLCYN